eukprot:m.162594 g.162594  ORF g.162594 m.162594 type:complete len:107 (-) comp21007_c0_seq14:44-364(-)
MFCKVAASLPQSAFPPLLRLGDPKRHHIIVNMLAELTEDHHNVALTLQQSELNAAAWLNLEHLKTVLGEKETEDVVDALVVREDQVHLRTKLPLNPLARGHHNFAT